MRKTRITRSSLVVVAFVALMLSIAPTAGATPGTLVIGTDLTLTEDHQGSIVVSADNITLNCDGHAVSGPGTAGVDWGIIVLERTGVTVKNCIVTGFEVGIRVSNTSSTDIRGNVVTGQSGNGLLATGTTDDSFRSNEFSGNGAHGISILFCAGSQFFGNVLSSNGRSGLAVSRSTGAAIASNQAHDNAWSGILLVGSSGNEVRDNKTNYNGESGIGLQGSADGSDSNGNTLTGNSGTGNGWFGIDLAFFSAVVNGDPSSAAFSNVLKGNKATGNAMSGFGVFGDSSSNLIQENMARSNGDFDGLDASTGSGNTWANNRFGSASGF